MSIVLDLILIAIILIFAISSARRGFVKVLVETVGIIAAVFIAFTISTPISNTVYDKIIEPPVIEAAVNAVGETPEHEAWNALPDFIVESDLDIIGESVNKFTDNISANLANGVETAVKTASQEVVKPVATQILSLLISVVLIFVLLVIVKMLAKVLNKLFSFSIVGKLNTTLGGVVGVVKGILFAMVFCLVISLIISFTGKPLWIFSPDNIANSVLFKFFTNLF